MNTYCVTELHFVQGCHGVQRLHSKLVARRSARRMSVKFKRRREIGQTSPTMDGEQHIMLALLQVIPTLLHFSGILSDIYSDILSGIYSDILSDILSGIVSGVLFGMCSDPGVARCIRSWEKTGRQE